MSTAWRGAFDPTSAKVVLALCIADYAEIWVHGDLPRAAGRPSPATIQGFTMPQRLVLSEAVAPGDTFQMAVFGINGPISAAPANTVWFREARVEFFESSVAQCGTLSQRIRCNAPDPCQFCSCAIEGYWSHL
jgi:hypothetical protein